MGKVNSFTDLTTWKEAHRLVIDVLDVIKRLSRSNFALIDQMSRSAISITSNIAEGFSRQSRKEKVQFYYIAKGSLTELQNQLLICKDSKLIDNNTFKQLADQSIIVGKLLTGLIRSADSRK